LLDLRTMYTETLVRNIIEAHFDQRDFQVAKETKDFYLNPSSYSGAIDLDCSSTSLKQRWIIEVKAENSDEYNYVKNFQAALTQLIYRMQAPELFPDYAIFYAVAVPGTKRYEDRCRAMDLPRFRGVVCTPLVSSTPSKRGKSTFLEHSSHLN
jgi:hypothetical protein